MLNPVRVAGLTKACLHYEYVVPAGHSVVVQLRLTPEALETPLRDVDEVILRRHSEADEFYAAIQPPKATEDEKRIQRQAFAGLLWTKQIYLFDVNELAGARQRENASTYLATVGT